MSALLNVPIPTIEQATANAARLLQQSLAQAEQAAAPGAMTATDIELARSNIAALAFVQGVGLHGAYAYLRDFIARQAVPITSSGEFLRGWLQTYGMDFKGAATASGTAGGTGVAGAVLPAGSALVSSLGARYIVTADAVVAGGVVTPMLFAETAGAAGNLPAASTLTLAATIVGIDATFTVGAGGISGGADAETDAQALYRLQQRLANPPMGGCPADYARWALEVPGITRAWGLRNPSGPTTAGVIIMADANAPYGLPTLAQRDAVLNYIRDPRRGPPDELFVIVPTPQVVAPALVLTPDTAAIRAGVTAALKDLFLREAVPGGDIPHAHLIDVVSDVAGEYNHQFTAPVVTSGGVFHAADYATLLVLGAVSFA